MKFVVIFLALVVFWGPVVGQSEPGSRDWVASYEPSSFENLPYRLMKPWNFESKKEYPVIVSLHGAGGRGTDNRKQLKIWNQQLADPERRQRFPCYVLAPQVTALWNREHLKAVQAILAQLPNVDRRRIYLMGHSMGGHGTNIWLQLAPNYFAAAVPSAGTGRAQDSDFIVAELIQDIPVWAFHGDRDTVCPIAPQRELFAEMKALGGNMKLTVFAGDRHGISGKLIPGAENGTTLQSGDRCDPEPDLLTWLFGQVLGE